ncbi:hypothetical protein GCM10008934_16280 [Virgibacillus salarius]|uniref:helix-turn-helix domain-containing protein n=1 Tax=Virgibacillus salarius TaxID=447199 RepID=UPI0031E168D2
MTSNKATKYETLSFENIEQYRTFETTAEMDAKIYEYIELLRSDEQPESVIEVLRFFGRSSLRIKGVSFAKYQTIADSIGVSKRTVIRAINMLSDYGMIERIATVKKWRRSVNIIRILTSLTPQDDTATEDEKTNADKPNNDEKETEPSIFNHLNNNSYVLESTAARNNIPAPLYNALSPFFYGEELRKYVGIVFRSKTRKVRIEAYADEFRACISDCILRYKRGHIRNLDGYLYASIRKLSRSLFLA